MSITTTNKVILEATALLGGLTLYSHASTRTDEIEALEGLHRKCQVLTKQVEKELKRIKEHQIA